MDAWGHYIARDRAAGIEAVVRQSFADDVSVGHHADQPVVLANRNGTYVMLTHQLGEFGHRRVWADPVDALVHHVFDLHGTDSVAEVCVSAPVPLSLRLYNRSVPLARASTPSHSGVFLIPRRNYCPAPRDIPPFV